MVAFVLQMAEISGGDRNHSATMLKTFTLSGPLPKTFTSPYFRTKEIKLKNESQNIHKFSSSIAIPLVECRYFKRVPKPLRSSQTKSTLNLSQHTFFRYVVVTGMIMVSWNAE